MPEVTMRVSLLRITDDSTRAEIAEAITHLRNRQLQATLATTKAEVQVVIDALLDVWAKACD